MRGSDPPPARRRLPPGHGADHRADVVRYLIERGATVDIFMAVALRDRALVERCACAKIPRRSTNGSARGNSASGTRARVRRRRRKSVTADIYRWVLGHYLTSLEVARGAAARTTTVMRSTGRPFSAARRWCAHS